MNLASRSSPSHLRLCVPGACDSAAVRAEHNLPPTAR